MLKNYLCSSIMVLIQTLLPMIALLIIAPLLLNTKIINQWQQPSASIQLGFIGLHGFFYLALIYLWPKLVRRLQIQNHTNAIQFRTALNARWYLLTIFLCFDALMLWRMV